MNLEKLEKIIKARIESNANDSASDSSRYNSYSAELAKAGLARACQKLGEEAVETIIAAVSNDKKNTCEEAADLLYHLLIVLYVSKIELADIFAVLESRHNKKK